MMEFAGLWGAALVAILRGLVRLAPGQPGAVTLYLDMPIDNPSKIEAFADFCARGPVDILHGPGPLVVQATFAERIHDNIAFSSWPIGYYLAHLAPRGALMRLLARHVLAPFPFLTGLVRNPEMALLGQDAALLPLMAGLDRAGLIRAMIINLSRFKSQPLWMKGMRRQSFPLHIVWYSQNCVPKVYKDENVDSDLPAMRHMRADVHWVWTEGFAGYLRGLGQQCRIEVVGPILFYPPGAAPELPQGRRVALFDIIPVASEKGVFGVAENYYSLPAIQKFVRDAAEATRELGEETGQTVWCLLKHKRVARAAHSAAAYPDFLDALQQEFDHFRLIDPDSNIYGLLDACDASIAVPYTTTCAVAASLRRPSAYYDPFATLEPRYERLWGVEFISDAASLKSFIGSAISRTG